MGHSGASRWRGRLGTVIAVGALSAVMAATGVYAGARFLRAKTYKNNEGIYSGYKDANVAVPDALGQIGRLNVPAGKFLAVGKTLLNGPFADCQLQAGGDFDRSILSGGGEETMTLTVVHSFSAPGQIRLMCADAGAGSTASHTKITAIRSRSLVNTPLP